MPIWKIKVDEEIYELEKNKVYKIELNEETGIIKIVFDDESEWNYRYLSIHSAKSVDAKLSTLYVRDRKDE
jgi:hypothetical protein